MPGSDGKSPFGLPAGELLPGERVLWSGRPVPSGFQVKNAGQAAFAVAWLVFAGAAATHFGSMPGPIRVVAGATWAIGGLSALGYIGYFIAAQGRFRRRDAYAITTWRVIAAPGLPGQRPRSAWLDQVTVSEQGGRDGVASLALSGPVPPSRSPRRPQGQFAPASQPEFPQFHDLADAAVARDVLARARAGMRAGEVGVEPPRAGLAALPPPSAVVLAPGEQLLWTGRPARVPAWFGWSDAWISGFGLFVVVTFAVVATVPGGLSGPNAAFFAIVIAFGAYLALGRVLRRWLRIRRAMYVLTSRRLIAAWGRAVAASDLRDLLPAQASGSSVISRPAAPLAMRGWDGWRLILAWPATTVTPPVLAGLADPIAVRDLVRQAQLAARAR